MKALPGQSDLQVGTLQQERITLWLLIQYLLILLIWIRPFPLLPQARPAQLAALWDCLPACSLCRCFIYAISLIVWGGLFQAIGIWPRQRLCSHWCLGLVSVLSLLFVLQDARLWLAGLIPLWLLCLAWLAPGATPQRLSNLLRVILLMEAWQMVQLGWGQGTWLPEVTPMTWGLGLLLEQVWLWGFCLSCLLWSRLGLCSIMVGWALLLGLAGLDVPLVSGLYLGLFLLLPRPQNRPLWPWLWMPISLCLSIFPGYAWLTTPEYLPYSLPCRLSLQIEQGPYTMRIQVTQKRARKWDWSGETQIQGSIWEGPKLLRMDSDLKGPLHFNNQLILDTRRLSALPSPLWSCPRIQQKWCKEVESLSNQPRMRASYQLREQP